MVGQRDAEIRREPDFLRRIAVVANGEKIKARRLVGRHERRQFRGKFAALHAERRRAVHAKIRFVSGFGVAQRQPSGREPAPFTDVVEVKDFRRQFARHRVGPVRREPVLLRVQAGRGVQPAIGHAKDMAERVRHRVVKGPRRERRADAERVAAIGEFKIRLRRAGRNFAVTDAWLVNNVGDDVRSLCDHFPVLI